MFHALACLAPAPGAEGKILYGSEAHIGYVIFNQPDKLNAMSVAMWDGLLHALSEFEADPQVRVLVLAGAGERAFVSGGDISQFEKLRGNADANREFQRLTSAGRSKLSQFAKPSIACIHGYCLGGGLAIAMAADLRIAAEGSSFGIPAARLGIAYGPVDVERLVALVGRAEAKMLLYTGDRLSAHEAHQAGLVNRVVALRDLERAVTSIASRIATNAPLSVAAAKFTVEEVVKPPGGRDEARLAAQSEICMNSQDYAEGRRAFMEKRPPQFTGE